MDFKTSKAFQRGKSKQLQAKSEQLQKENNEMEQRIVALRHMMQKEREERERLGGSRWKSSKLPQDGQPMNTTNTERKPTKPKGQPKFKILSDRPLEKYKTKAPVEEASETSFICGQCEESKAKLECVECGELYCPPCFKQFHAKGAMRKHAWQPIDQGRPLSSKRKAQNISNSKPRSPAQKTRESSVDESFSLDASVEYQESTQGGRLLEGTYNEKESAASFQEALREWRNTPADLPTQKNGLWVNPVEEEPKTGSKSCETETDRSVLPGVAQGVSDIKLTFNSTLSYADRLMLKKHRKDPEAAVAYNKPKNRPSPKLQAKQAKSRAAKSSPKNSRRSPLLGSHKKDLAAQETKQQVTVHHSEADYSRALQIQLLPSDEDDSKYDGSDQERISPIINYTATDEQVTPRTDRFTLSQMGRLAIVELSFSDPENDHKSKDGSISSGSASHSSLSLKRAASGMRNQYSERGQTTPPHITNVPTNTYIARQKILLEKNRKVFNGADSCSSKVKKILKREDRKWRPTEKYIGLNSFFMAGVEKENIENAVSIEGFQNRSPGNIKSPTLMETNSFPTISVGLADCWRPESSLSQVEEISLGREKFVSLPNKSGQKGLKNGIKVAVEGKNRPSTTTGKDSSGKSKIVKPSIVKSELSISDDNGTPRVSMTDFDFLSAMPPMSKGDDLHKLHRASTVTLFALSPQPPDVWNDDSEIDLPHAPPGPGTGKASSTGLRKVSKNVQNRKNSMDNLDREDDLALEALSKELSNESMMAAGVKRDAENHWEDESLSIEDNDDGSGLTSSGDGDTVDYDSDDSDADFQGAKKQIMNLKG